MLTSVSVVLVYQVVVCTSSVVLTKDELFKFRELCKKSSFFVVVWRDFGIECTLFYNLKQSMLSVLRVIQGSTNDIVQLYNNLSHLFF